jgi:hypothetical protein
MATSQDGITWTVRTTPFTNGPTNIVWNGSIWVATGSGTNSLAWSVGGTTWTPSTTGNAIFTTSGGALTWNGTYWLALGVAGGVTVGAYSSDGKTWASTSGITATVLSARHTLPFVGININYSVSSGSSGQLAYYNGSSVTGLSNIIFTPSTITNERVTIQGSLLPSASNYTLGTIANPWQSLHLSGNTISLGGVGTALIKSSVVNQAQGTEVAINTLKAYMSSAGILWLGTNTGSAINVYGQALWTYQGGGPTSTQISLVNLTTMTNIIEIKPSAGNIGDTIVANVNDTTNGFFYRITGQQYTSSATGNYSIIIEQLG